MCVCVCVCVRARARACVCMRAVALGEEEVRAGGGGGGGGARLPHSLGRRPLFSVVSTKQAEHGCVVSTSVRIRTEQQKSLFRRL